MSGKVKSALRNVVASAARRLLPIATSTEFHCDLALGEQSQTRRNLEFRRSLGYRCGGVPDSQSRSEPIEELIAARRQATHFGRATRFCNEHGFCLPQADGTWLTR